MIVQAENKHISFAKPSDRSSKNSFTRILDALCPRPTRQPDQLRPSDAEPQGRRRQLRNCPSTFLCRVHASLFAHAFTLSGILPLGDLASRHDETSPHARSLSLPSRAAQAEPVACRSRQPGVRDHFFRPIRHLATPLDSRSFSRAGRTLSVSPGAKDEGRSRTLGRRPRKACRPTGSDSQSATLLHGSLVLAWTLRTCRNPRLSAIPARAMPTLPGSVAQSAPTRYMPGHWQARHNCSNAELPVCHAASPLLGHENLALAHVVGRADQAALLHLLDQPRSLVVADGKLALDVGSRALSVADDDLDGLIVERILSIRVSA